MCTTARIALFSLALMGAAWCAVPPAARAQADSAGVDSADAWVGPPPGAPAAPAPAAPAPGAAAAGSLLNPNISVIGWFQAEAGDHVAARGGEAFALREAEIGLQAAVDPYSRADFFIAVSPEEGVDLEEGYLTLLSLPAGVSAKLGKFRHNFGKFNRTHPPETPFADRPLIAETYFGEEGLAGMGASASWLAPLPFYLNLDAEVTNTPARDEGPAFDAHRGKDLLFTTRIGTFVELGEAASLTLGASYANGANGPEPGDFPGDSTPANRTRLHGADVTFRWKNPRRAIYRSLVVSIEAMGREAGGSDPADVPRGAFGYVDYQPVRRWHVGARYDWEDNPRRFQDDFQALLAFLTFTPSEFSALSLQASHVTDGTGHGETRGYFKTTFNIGPHGAHPF